MNKMPKEQEKNLTLPIGMR